MKTSTLLSAIAIALAASGAQAADSPPSYRESPVFFEVVRDGWVDPRNDEVVLRDKVTLPPLGTEKIRNFDWKHHRRKDASWWLRVERFDYLLSVIESDRPEHRRFAAAWFSRWYKYHEGVRKPNAAAWQGMIAGIRVMVFVRYLKREEQRDDADAELVARLRAAIEEHQRFLADPQSFEARSNHGMWNGIGLLETTRVYPDPQLTGLALDRLVRLTGDSVSNEGVHREHSPSYHFGFMRWLTNFVRYLSSLEGPQWAQLTTLESARERMQAAAYYLCDHKGNIPRIGDSGGEVDEAVARDLAPIAGRPWLWAPQAGYAVFKDDPSSLLRRYVVFNIQNQQHPTELIYHFHNDVSAVYYNDDGEVILSDQGRYSYTESDLRDYFQSLAAHNVVFPAEHLSQLLDLQFAERAWKEAEKHTVHVETFGGRVRRSLTIPPKDDGLVVADRILARSPFVALWNIGPDVARMDRVEGGSGEFRWVLTTVSGRRFALDITVKGNARSDQATVQEISGSRKPWLGWQATGFEKMEPSRVLRFELRPRERLWMTTRVRRLP